MKKPKYKTGDDVMVYRYYEWIKDSALSVDLSRWVERVEGRYFKIADARYIYRKGWEYFTSSGTISFFESNIVEGDED